MMSTTHATALDFLVRRDDLRTCRVQDSAVPTGDALQPGQVLLRVHRFALTANNITYGVFGDAMAYWNFFPAADGWGRIPVWGFADVESSRHDAVTEGERVYGYFPMSTHLLVQADRVSDAGFVDASAHRAPLPAAYNFYRRSAADPGYDASREPQQMILQPLYVTSYLIEDFLRDNDLFGARRVVIASASSKTALGLAFLLSRNRGAPEQSEVVGLTSPRNLAFTQGVGYYDRVLTYDALDALAADVDTVFVDMAGDGKLLHDVHHRLGERLRYSCIVGATHWENRETQHNLPGAKPQFFFAPTQYVKRTRDWGREGLEQRFGQAWQAFLGSVDGWLKVIEGRGPEAVEAVYRDTLEGRTTPEQGHVLSLQGGNA
jgi:hypothetical protein